MKAISWNCRGAASPKFQLCLNELIRTHTPDLLFLMEPRVHSRKGKKILNKYAFTNFVAVEAEGFSGGLWCFWNKLLLNVQVLNYSNEIINLAITKNDGVDWVFSLVYASPTEDIRFELWQQITKLGSIFRCPWCLIGDFNEILSQSDKKGGRRATRTQGLHRVLELCELTPLPFSGPKYTWSNGRPGARLILERIDFAFSNVAWSNKFSDARLSHLTKMSSDHHSLLLQLRPPSNVYNAPRLFRFQT